MTRTLWITERYPPTVGGMAVSCARIVDALRASGRDLDVLSLGGPTAEIRIETRPRDRGRDTRVTRSVSRGYTAQKCWQLVRDWHRRTPYDSVVGFGASGAGHLATTFAAWLSLPAATLVRGNDLDRDWFDPRRAAMLQGAFERSQVIGCVSQDKVGQVQGLYPRADVRFTPNSVDVERFRLLPDDEARRSAVRDQVGSGKLLVGLFGELKAKKRVPFWLAAVRDAGLIDSLELLVVGSADAATEALLADASLAPKVHAIPFSPRDELAGLYAACDLVAIPSMYEGMSNVMLEAMACGVPVLATDVGGMADVLLDDSTGWLFPAEDLTAAGDATRRAIDCSPARRSEMGQAAKAAVAENFGPERELAGYCELLDILHTNEGETP